jgi:hypothetical protein
MHQKPSCRCREGFRMRSNHNLQRDKSRPISSRHPWGDSTGISLRSLQVRHMARGTPKMTKLVFCTKMSRIHPHIKAGSHPKNHRRARGTATFHEGHFLARPCLDVRMDSRHHCTETTVIAWGSRVPGRIPAPFCASIVDRWSYHA